MAWGLVQGPCIGQGSLEKQNQRNAIVCVHILLRETEGERRIHFKELAHAVMGAEKSKSAKRVAG